MTTPQRIQQRRTKGWRKPEGAVAVGRQTRWGNPFRVGQRCQVWHLPGGSTDPRDLYLDVFHVTDAAHAVRLFERAMQGDLTWTPNGWVPGIVPDLTALRGKDLMCWCPLDQPCHADVLLEVANGGAA